MNTDFCELVFEDEQPVTTFPDGPEVENDHYMDKGYNMFKRATLTMHSYHTYIQVSRRCRVVQGGTGGIYIGAGWYRVARAASPPLPIPRSLPATAP